MANLTRYSPLTELQREVDRLFNEFLPARPQDGASLVWSPAADLWETDDSYLISLDLPGLTKQDVEITFEHGTLQVSGERKMTQEVQERQYHRIERRQGRFFRTFRFDRSVNPDQIEARFRDGVLTLQVPKTEESRPRRIQIS